MTRDGERDTFGEPKRESEAQSDLLQSVLHGFNETAQELVVGDKRIAMQMPHAGPCKMELIPPSGEEEDARLHITWGGTELYLDVFVSGDGETGWIDYRTSRGHSNGSISLKRGASPLEALVQSIENYVDPHWVDTQPVGDA